MSAEFNWQSAFHKEHDDLCALEARNYVLKQRIKVLEAKIAKWEITDEWVEQQQRIEALEAALREIIRVDSSNPDLMDGYALEGVIDIARKALGEGKP